MDEVAQMGPGDGLPDREFAAFLFDMDGTLIDSIAAAERIWGRWARRHELDVAAVTRAMHGVRAIETIRRFGPPGIDVEAEAAALTQAEIDDLEGIVAIDGADRFLRSLPPDRWIIVTSAPRALALRRLQVAALPIPRILVTADDVARGKPSPDCFLAAAEALGFPIRECLVWEDAPAGVAAAEAAGATVIVIGATHVAPMVTVHPVIAGYAKLTALVGSGGGLRLLDASD